MNRYELAGAVVMLGWIIAVFAGAIGWWVADLIGWAWRRYKVRRVRIEAVRQRYLGILS